MHTQTDTVYCNMSSWYDGALFCQRGGVSSTLKAKLFRGIVQTKDGERLRKNGGLSYTRLRAAIGEIVQVGFNLTQKHLICHSLQAEGAANAGVEDRLFKRHNR